ncbi:50S ribosome-binding GTPase [Candidatus Pacearchaeota archaeon]|nr:50S ribosome-binding GTPase [Candidatus Pacearchaeota archaeon]
MGYWPIVRDLLRNVDIVLLIADARMPDLSVNEELVEKANLSSKTLIVVFNKIDLLSEMQLKKLKNEYPDAYFVSGIKNLHVALLKRGLQILAKRMKLDAAKIGVVGYPNMGKSAVINALAHGRRAEVADLPGTTKGVQWIKVSNLLLLDSPGVIPFDDRNSKLSLLGAKSPDKLSNPDKAAKDILFMFLMKNKQALQDFYKLDAVSIDVDELFASIGRKRGHLRKGGVLDEQRTAVAIIRDWQKGKLRL